MDANSAMLAYTNSIPHTFTMNPQNRLGKPPVMRVSLKSTKSTSQLAMTVLANPSIVTNLKFLCLHDQHIWYLVSNPQSCPTLRTCFFPSMAMSRRSAVHVSVNSLIVTGQRDTNQQSLDISLESIRPPHSLSCLLGRKPRWLVWLASRSPC